MPAEFSLNGSYLCQLGYTQSEIILIIETVMFEKLGERSGLIDGLLHRVKECSRPIEHVACLIYSEIVFCSGSERSYLSQKVFLNGHDVRDMLR